MNTLHLHPSESTLGQALAAFLELTRQRVQAGTRSPATLEMHQAHARHLLERIPAETRLAELGESHLAAVVAAEREGRRVLASGDRRPVTNSTLRKRLSTLLGAYKVAGLAPPRLPELPHRYRPSRRFLETLGDLEDLLAELPQHRREWIALAVWTGQRHSDIERATRADFDPDCPPELGGPWVRIRGTKTRDPDGIKVAAMPELVAALGPRWRQLGPGDPLVEPWPHVSSQLTRLCHRLGRPVVTAQSFRHTLFTWLVSANGFTPEIIEMGRWRSPAMLMTVYGHALPTRFSEVLARARERLLAEARRPPQRSSPAIPPARKAPRAGVQIGVEAPAGGRQPAQEARRRATRA